MIYYNKCEKYFVIIKTFILTVLIVFIFGSCITNDMTLFSYIEDEYRYAKKESQKDFEIKKTKAYRTDTIYYEFSSVNERGSFVENALLFLYYLDSKIDKTNLCFKEGYCIIISREGGGDVRLTYYPEKEYLLSVSIYGNYDNINLFDSHKRVIIYSYDFTEEQKQEIREKYPGFENR